MFKPGDKVLNEHNRELGPGVVEAVEGNRMRVHFPSAGETLTFSLRDHAFVPLTLPPGHDPERWHEIAGADLAERLLRGENQPFADFQARIAAGELVRLRDGEGPASFLGGRIRIFPHQLHVAAAAVAADPVRWLLADEVGLGKTIEACMILNRLRRTKRAERVVVIAPSTLTVQWLGELYRKFHQIFVLLDRQLMPAGAGARTSAGRDDVFEDRGDDYNPFLEHAGTILSLEDLVANPRARDLALVARPDLVIVDEAHNLERRPGEEGNAAYQAVAPILAVSRHSLLLTATPLEADVSGFHTLLALLWPDRVPPAKEFTAALARGELIVPCTSATRRADIGGLPPRVPKPVEVDDWSAAAAASESGASDPRLAWILSMARGEWRRQRSKTLIFSSERTELEMLEREIEFSGRQRVAVFHEGLSPAERDIEVAQFAQSEGPGILISTEAGGEGRNFEFCRRLVLYDLPWDPTVVEQRIGRLDRIGRRWPVEIVYFRPRAADGESFALEVVRLYETLGVFTEPLGTLEEPLHHVEAAIRRAVESSTTTSPVLDIPAIVAETRERKEAVQRAIYHHLHQNRYRPEDAAVILATLPADLDSALEQLVVDACRRYAFTVVEHPDDNTWYLEFGETATVEGLPGIPEGSRWLGTFDRETAVAREAVDFFAFGHPLVDAVLAEIEDGRDGRIAHVVAAGSGVQGSGVIGIVRTDPGKTEVLILDHTGAPRPEWQPLLLAPDVDVRDVATSDPLPALEHLPSLAAQASASGDLLALALFVLEP